MSCMSLKTFESLHMNLTKDRFPTVVTATGTSMDPIGFTQCTFNINGHSFMQKFIVCTNQTRPVILGKDFAARNCIGIIWTKQGSRKMIDDDNKVQTTFSSRLYRTVFAYVFLVFSFRGVRFCLGNICERFACRDLC